MSSSRGGMREETADKPAERGGEDRPRKERGPPRAAAALPGAHAPPLDKVLPPNRRPPLL